MSSFLKTTKIQNIWCWYAHREALGYTGQVHYMCVHVYPETGPLTLSNMVWHGAFDFTHVHMGANACMYTWMELCVHVHACCGDIPGRKRCEKARTHQNFHLSHHTYMHSLTRLHLPVFQAKFLFAIFAVARHYSSQTGTFCLCVCTCVCDVLIHTFSQYS